MVQGIAQGAGDDVGLLVDVAQAVGLVDDDEVPADAGDVVRLVPCELVGAEQDLVGVEGIGRPGGDGLVVGLGLQDAARQEELFLKLLVPLLAQVGRGDDQDAPLALRPALREDQTRLDGLAEPDLVGEDRPPGQGGAEREQRGLDLVRVQVHLRIDKGAGQLLHAVRRDSGW